MSNKIKHYREQKCLTQKKLAEKSEISERNLQSIEAGVQDPRASIILRIAKALDKKVEDLYPDGYSQ